MNADSVNEDKGGIWRMGKRGLGRDDTVTWSFCVGGSRVEDGRLAGREWVGLIVSIINDLDSRKLIHGYLARHFVYARGVCSFASISHTVAPGDTIRKLHVKQLN